MKLFNIFSIFYGFYENPYLNKNLNANGFQSSLKRIIQPFVKKLFMYGQRLFMNNCRHQTTFLIRMFFFAENY